MLVKVVSSNNLIFSQPKVKTKPYIKINKIKLFIILKIRHWIDDENGELFEWQYRDDEAGGGSDIGRMDGKVVLDPEVR